MSAIQDHPLRYELANELHARPFPSLDAPGRVAYLAFTQNTEGGDHSRLNARDQLIALLDRFRWMKMLSDPMRSIISRACQPVLSKCVS